MRPRSDTQAHYGLRPDICVCSAVRRCSNPEALYRKRRADLTGASGIAIFKPRIGPTRITSLCVALLEVPVIPEILSSTDAIGYCVVLKWKYIHSCPGAMAVFAHGRAAAGNSSLRYAS